MPDDTVAGRFSYSFLDQFREVLSDEYILMDSAIDLVGFHLCKDLYPERTIDFGKYGNAAWSKKWKLTPTGKKKKTWRVIRPMWSKIYGRRGPEFSIETGVAKRPPRHSKFGKFRTAASTHLLTFILHRKVNPYYLLPTGQQRKFNSEDLDVLRLRRKYVTATGGIWLVTGGGPQQFVVILINKQELESAIASRLKLAVLSPRKPEKPEPPDELVLRYIGHIAVDCINKKKLIAIDAAKQVVRTFLADEFKQPSGKQWRSQWDAVALRTEGKAFCSSGNPGKRSVLPKGEGREEKYAADLKERLGPHFNDDPQWPPSENP